MTRQTRKRLIPVGGLVVFVIVVSVVGLIARSTTAATCNAPTTTTAGELTSADINWYWTMVVAPGTTDLIQDLFVD